MEAEKKAEKRHAEMMSLLMQQSTNAAQKPPPPPPKSTSIPPPVSSTTQPLFFATQPPLFSTANTTVFDEDGNPFPSFSTEGSATKAPPIATTGQVCLCMIGKIFLLPLRVCHRGAGVQGADQARPGKRFGYLVLIIG